jgi:hypothetical protein
MKTFEQIADDVSKELFDIQVDGLSLRSNTKKVYNIAAKRYAEQALDEAAENATVTDSGTYGSDGQVCEHWEVDKQSILSIKTKLK